MKCSIASGSISSQKPAFFSLTLLSRSMIHECRTKHPPDKTPPAHFGIGGQNTPHVFYRVDITPPATYERVDKTPPRKFCKVDKIPPIMWTKPPLRQNPLCLRVCKSQFFPSLKNVICSMNFMTFYMLY